ncbi:MAG: hypothetical protein F6J93_18955 [Oscillatoria sp. SIO1A7]|nr:hypothetical protein [Oscillatoria sp. SIO1A7]
MTDTYVIHPAIGVARVGNHDDEFFLAPNEIGGLPINCDANGNETGGAVSEFKVGGKIKRQGQKFRVYKYDDTGNATEVDLSDSTQVESVTWTVRLANKKAVWYEYSELLGNLLLGENNSYQNQNVPRRNDDVSDRQTLIIDSGEVQITGTEAQKELNDQVPGSHFPNPDEFDFPGKPDDNYGTLFTKIGDLKTDSQGNLIVLGGHGDSWGLTELEGYGGGNYWFDDISDGSVTCEFTPVGGTAQKLQAWVIVGPPDFAPEISNISSWDDTAFDVAVREFDLVPEMYLKGQRPLGFLGIPGWNPDFMASYERDILPIINRISGYHWVANVQSMIAFSSNIFDFSDPSDDNKPNRQKYFSYFRQPESKEVVANGNPPPPYSAPSVQTNLFSGQTNGSQPYTGIPLMPLNSGSNSVSEANIKKFLTLTETQYFLLYQWSEGKFYKGETPTDNHGNVVAEYPLCPEDSASIGNVVGLPQCPGIEVTWTTQNQAIYEVNQIGQSNKSQIEIKQAVVSGSLGDENRDECATTYQSCEPGDLTKRMAIPWQADFYNCTYQLVNYTDPDTNKVEEGGESVPLRPNYFAYWWPPQAPWDVLNGLNLIANQHEHRAATIEKDSYDNEKAGWQMNYFRGINSYSQMVNLGWASLAFIRNVGEDEQIGENGPKSSELFPYFVETERNYDEFQYHKFAIKFPGMEEEVEFIVTDLEPVERKIEVEKGLINEKLKNVENLMRPVTVAGLNKLIPIVHEDPGISYVKSELEQMEPETLIQLAQEYRDKLQKRLKAVQSFRKIKVTRKLGEVPRSGRRIRF